MSERMSPPKTFEEIFDYPTIGHDLKNRIINEKAETEGWILIRSGDSVCLKDGARSLIVGVVTKFFPISACCQALRCREIHPPSQSMTALV
jgi:hypothetical protein